MVYLRKKGFTLIELLVVISIIGLLSSVVLASLSTARQKAKSTKKIAELRQIMTAIQSYNIQNNTMPANVNLTPTPDWCRVGVTYSGNVCLGELITAGYFTALPTSPDANPYYYWDSGVGTYALVASTVVPEAYGPGTRGWHCSDAAGGTPGSKFYCVEMDR